MKQLLIIAISIICCSCSSLVMNQGLKSYKSEVAKTEEYKKANGFQQDLLYLNDLCENSFPEIDSVFPHQLRESVVDSLMNLLSENEINKEIFIVYARYYLSHFDNEHTRIHGGSGIGLYPYILKSTGEDWYLWDINKEYDSLLIGKKVIEINNESIDRFEKKLFHYVCAENDISKRNKLKSINRPSLLKQYDLIEQTDSILLSFENGDRTWVKSIYEAKDIHFHLGKKRSKPNVVTEKVDYNYNMTFYPDENFAYLQYNKCYDKIDLFEELENYVKPWVIPFAKLYVKRLIKKKKVPKNDLGFKLDYDRLVFKDYLKLMFDSLQTQNLDNLVIDLRNNAGGSHLLCLQLLYYLTDREDLKGFSVKYHMSDFNRQIYKSDFNKFVEFYRIKNGIDPEYGKLYSYGYNDYDSLLFEKIEDPKSVYYLPKERKVFKGKIIVLANHQTGSAAALLTALMQDNNIATVIGTSVSNNPIGATTYSLFKLPNSKLTGSVAPDYFVRPNPKNGKIFIPDYWIENNVEDIINGKDKYLEKAMELMNNY